MKTTLTCCFVGALLLATPASGVERQTLRGHVPEAVRRLKLQPLGRLPTTNRLHLAIGLPLRNTNELARLLQDLYDSASPQFRHYLTPEQFAAGFGPTEMEYEAVRQFAMKSGLEITVTDPNRVVLDVAARVADIERAFQITLNTYRHPTEARKFYAPDAEPSVDAGLAVLGISGLNNYAVPHPTFHATDRPYSARPGTGSGPKGCFIGKDLRNAYAPGVTLDGAGQSVGLLAFEAFYAADITAYEKMAGLPNVPIQVVLLDGFNGINTDPTAGGEANLDIDMAISMAPGLSNVVVFDAGPNGNLIDILRAMANHPQIKQFSSSWIWWGTDQGTISTCDNLLRQMAVQGQSIFEASGDGDAWYNNPISNAPWLADDPYVTSVGGTSLTMSGSGASYASETVWNYGLNAPGWAGSVYVGSGGGISIRYPLPSWQQGLDLTASLGSRSRRNFPDVAMAADNYSIVFQGTTYTGGWGTSFAAPLWAGFTALINQEAAAHGRPPVGFLNPALYALGQVANYTNSFHDITAGNNASDTSGGLFPAVPGYDLGTGWGSPKDSHLIHALALPERLVITPNSNFLITGPAGGPFAPDAVTWSLTNRIGSLDWGLSLDADWLSISPTNGTHVAGNPSTIVSIVPNLLASNLVAGSYTANLFFTNLMDQSVQSRQITLAVVTPPVITSQPTNQGVQEGITAVFSVGTAPNAMLYYQWQFDDGSGATHLTDAGGISGSATSRLTIDNVGPAQVGAYSVVVSNAAGFVPSASASLTILTGQPPVVLSQPVSQTRAPAAGAVFSVRAAGDPPLSYAWRLNGTSLADTANLHGSATRTLTIASATARDTGSYSVVVTNSSGSVTSAVAVLNLTGVTSAGVTLQALYSFNTNAAGCVPYGGLVQATDGNFYGTTCVGGAFGGGTIFRMRTNGTVLLVHTFANDNSGGIPYAGLIQAKNGFLYGTTSIGGTTGDGTVFRATTNGALTAYSLNSTNSGSYPVGGLVQGQDGNVYGTTVFGGAYTYGAVFKLTSSGVLTAFGSFNSEDGAYLSAPVLQGADGNFYGTARKGGTNGGWGTIFKITTAGTLNALFSFTGTNGANPMAGLTLDPDGNFYGTTYDGGANGLGSVFKLGADGTFSSLYSFSGGMDGANCFAGLFLASDGNLYGTTENGGAYNLGTVFRVSPGGALVTLTQFDGYQGANPEGTLMQGTDGNLYGTTSGGGTNGLGAIYRLSIDAPLQITGQPQPQTVYVGDAATFSVATFGSPPVYYQWRKNGTNLVDSGNLAGANGRVLTLTNVDVPDVALYSVVVSNVYGSLTSAVARLEVIYSPPYVSSGPDDQTVLAGGTVSFNVEAGGDGALGFQWQKNGTNLANGGSISGATTATLTLAAVATTNAGTYSVIVSNAIDAISSPSAVLTVVPVTPPSASFASQRSFSGGVSGFNPHGALVQGTDGNLYGTTRNGGVGYAGTVFRAGLPSGFAVTHSFTNGPDGAVPYAGLVEASPNTFYGVSFWGGASLEGAFFKITSTSAFTPLHSFGDEEGANPLAALVLGGDGKLYGTASTGGSNALGTVFSLTTNGVLTSLWSFDARDGSHPVGPLVPASDGKLYGLTSGGGANDLGTAFSLSPDGLLTSLASFDYATGSYPSNGLVLASDGAFYGTASHGGTNGGWGTVFRMNSDGTLISLHSFDWIDGAFPTGGLVEGSDGNLYGTTSQGGVGGEGTVFQITPNGVLSTLVWFNGFDGASPQASLIQSRNGSFYGTAEFGGVGYRDTPGTGNGLVFRLTLPLFLSQSFTQAVAMIGVPYAASLATNAVGPSGDILTFAKVSGPAWLSVASDGTLSGTPTVRDVGSNLFSVSLADKYGWTSSATLSIAVVPTPTITAVITSQGANLVLSWSGRLPPYQVQMAEDLLSPNWQNAGSPTTNTTLLLAPTNAAAFYRILGQ